MMPSAVHFSTCGTNSLAKKRRACSSSSTRSSVIQAGRGTCSESIGVSFPVELLCAALIVDQMRGFVFEPFIAGLARQRMDAFDPRDFAFRPVLLGRRHGF